MYQAHIIWFRWNVKQHKNYLTSGHKNLTSWIYINICQVVDIIIWQVGIKNLTSRHHYFKSRLKDLASPHKDLTSPHKDLTNRQKDLTSRHKRSTKLTSLWQVDIKDLRSRHHYMASRHHYVASPHLDLTNRHKDLINRHKDLTCRHTCKDLTSRLIYQTSRNN